MLQAKTARCVVGLSRMYGYVVHAGKNRTDEDAMSRGFDSRRFCERAWERVSRKIADKLLQLRVFGLGLL
jgi:hypothetical protein